MLYTKYLLKRGSSFLISKLYFKNLSQLPYFLSAELVLWFDLQLYKKIKIIIFIFLYNCRSNQRTNSADKK